MKFGAFEQPDHSAPITDKAKLRKTLEEAVRNTGGVPLNTKIVDIGTQTSAAMPGDPCD